jgi:hypothetical protein
MQENIGQTVIGHDEAEALGDIEPLDAAADLNEFQGVLFRRCLGYLAATLIERGILPLEIERVRAVIASHEITQTRIKNPILNEKITSS